MCLSLERKVVLGALLGLGLACGGGGGEGGGGDEPPDVAAPTTRATPAAGTYAVPVTISLLCDDGAGSGCAATYYTTDGTQPTTGSPVFRDALPVAGSATLRFFSVDRAGNAETVRAASYVIDGTPPTVSAAPRGGAYREPQDVTLACDDGAGSGCAEIRYTLDGSAPSRDSAPYAAPVHVGADATLTFRGYDAAGNASAPVQETYRIDLVRPTVQADPAGGTHRLPQTVALTCLDDSGACAAIHYTLDGTAPTTSSAVYSGPLAVAATAALRFIGVDPAGNVSAEGREEYLIDGDPPSTTPSPAGTTSGTALAVTLSCSDAGSGCAATYYTVDGGVPTEASPRYAAPIAVASTTTLRFFSVDAAGNAEAARTERYVIDVTAPFTSASPPPGAYASTRNVTLVCSDGESGCEETRYTTDGTDPGPTSPAYAGPIAVSTSLTLRFFSTDAVGNAETVRTAAYVIDAAPPVTTATPLGGAFTAATSVTLSCADTGGSGCVAVHYTTNGATPTTSSPAYASPIALPANATTTLRYFARDGAGNREAVQTQVYVVDTIRPSVTSSVPTAGKTNVSTGTTVRVTFSEPMDPASIDASTFTVVDSVTRAAVAGTRVYDAATRTATFTPSAALANGRTYVVTVSVSLRDVAGNAMAAGYPFTFTTATAIDQVSTDTSAYHRNGGIACNAAGDCVAIWSAVSGTGAKVLYSTCTATGTWTAEAAIWTSASASSSLPPATAVATNGTDFMIAWVEFTTIKAARVAGGVPGTPTVLRALGSWGSGDTLHVVSNGTGYAVAWRSAQTVTAAVYSGSAWTAATDLESDFQASDGLSIAGNSSGYLAAFRLGTQIWATRYAGAWSAPFRLDSATSVGFPAVAARPGAFCVAWTQGSAVVARIGDGASFAAPQTISSGGSSHGRVSAAASASGFGVAWVHYDGADYSVFANLHDGAAWTGQALLEASGAYAVGTAIASNGSGYLVAMLFLDTANDVYDLLANVWDGGWRGATALEARSDDARNPAVAARGAGYRVTWDQNAQQSSQIWIARYDAGSFGATVTLVQLAHGGSARNVRLGEDGTGRVLALWLQQHRDSESLMAALRTGGVWGNHSSLGAGASEPAVAAAGSTFLVAYARGGSVYARTYTGAFNWGTETLVGSGRSPAVASSAGAFVVAWETGGGQVRARTFTLAGGAWGPDTLLDSVGTGGRPSVASRGGDFMVAWTRQDSAQSTTKSALASLVTSSGGVWTFGPPVLLEGATTIISAGPLLAATPQRYAAVWTDGLGAQANVYAAAWQAAPTVLDTSAAACGDPAVAGGGVRMLAVFDCGGIRAAEHDGSAWRPDAAVGGVNVMGTALASSGNDFKLVYQSSNQSMNFATYAGGAWSPIELLEDRTQPLGTGFDLVHSGTDYAAAWMQQDPSDPTVMRTYARGGF